MIKVLFLGLFASISLYAVEGTYVGSGTDPDNKGSYTVTATFTKDKNGTYQATWDEMRKGSSSHYEGTGLEQGGYLSFVYQNADDASDAGIQMYKIKGNTLEGRFVPIHENSVGNEKLSLSQK